jgi:hypothetical protein
MNKEPNVLGLGMIKNDELPVWIHVLSNDLTDSDGNVRPGTTDPEKIMKELRLINDLLTLQKCKSLLTRKRGLKDILEARIAQEIGLPTGNMNRRKL